MHLCYQLVSDVRVVEPPPQLKGHSATPTCTHQFPLQWASLGEEEGVACLVVEGRVGHAQSCASAVGVEEYLRIWGWGWHDW